MSDFVPWLRGLADKGGTGVVNAVDARSLGRIADEIERLRDALKEIEVARRSISNNGLVEVGETAAPARQGEDNR